MADSQDLPDIIANNDDKSVVLSSVNLHSQEDTNLERQLRELKFKQELRKDWIIFIVRDVVVFSTGVVFIFAVGGYALFTLIKSNSYDNEKNFATFVALIVTGLVSFVIGRATAIRE